MTTIALFGASGRLGQRVLLRALVQGFSVRALVRDPTQLEDDSRRLTVLVGDVLDPTAVARTIDGADIVVSMIGPTPGASRSLITDATAVIAAEMIRAGVRRIITLTGGGVEQPGDRPRIADRGIVFVLRTFQGHLLVDSRRHIELLRASDLEWTVVRAPRLTVEPGVGHYRVGAVGEHGSTRISRDDLADFVVDLLSDGRFVRELPFVTE